MVSPAEYQQYQEGLENVDARSMALRDQLTRAQDRYLQWRMGQQRDLQNREMALERLKAEIDQRVQISAQAMATQVAQLEYQAEAYAAAIARALVATENPWASRRDAVPGIGQNIPRPAAPQPLRLPGG